MAIPPKKLIDAIGDGQELYEFLRDVVSGKVRERKVIRDRGGDLEIDVPVDLKTRASIAQWLLEQLNGKAVQRSEVSAAPIELPDVRELTVEELRALASGIVKGSSGDE